MYPLYPTLKLKNPINNLGIVAQVQHRMNWKSLQGHNNFNVRSVHKCTKTLKTKFSKVNFRHLQVFFSRLFKFRFIKDSGPADRTRVRAEKKTSFTTTCLYILAEVAVIDKWLHYNRAHICFKKNSSGYKMEGT